MSLFDDLTEQPWKTQGAGVDRRSDSAVSLPAVALGLRVFLAVVTVVFALLVVSYAARMTHGGWHGDWLQLPKPWLLWLNTALLVLSSVGLQKAHESARREQIDGVRTGLLTAGASTCAFLVGQLLAVQQLIAAGYFSASNPAFAFFCLVIVVHGLHLLGGLIAWGRTAAKVWDGCEAADVRLSVELCALYWHFLLAVWLILFCLLLFT